MSKIFLAISTGAGEIENIKELTASFYNFDGLAVTYHGTKEDEEYKLLENRKGNGFVEIIPYFGHHGHDLNHILFNPKIDQSSWLLLRDSSERVNPDFAANIKDFIKMLEYNGINTVYNYSKLLLFKRFPHQYFVNSPHWGLVGVQDKMISIEASGLFSREEDYCYSIRNRNRDKYHFVWHYLKYFSNILDSNHCLLGNEKNQNQFQIDEGNRRQFRRYLETNNYLPLTPEKFIWICNNKLEDIKYLINNNKILNDAYRYLVLKQTDFNDDHDNNNLVKI
jgi:hypothetical protein